MASKPKDWKDEAETLDFDSIRERLEHYERLKEGKLAAKRREALDQIKEIMAGAELTIDEIVEEFTPKRVSKSKVATPGDYEYMNPDNPKERWRRKGPKPAHFPKDEEGKARWRQALVEHKAKSAK